MEYITVKEAGERWGLGTRMVTVYCAEGKIGGAMKKGNLWLIPEDATRPEDRRCRKSPVKQEQGRKDSCDMFEPKDHQERQPFESLYENKDLFAHIFKEFSYPILICTPIGTMLLANKEYLKFAKISNPGKLCNKHNVLLNPNLERWGIKDFMSRAFQGEAVHAHDVKVPYQEVIENLGDSNQLAPGSLFQNITALPIRGKDKQLEYVVFIFITSRSYLDREEIIKGKEYIDSHWKEQFDIERLAGAVHMSSSHYTHLFKRHTGMTPYNYYKEVKINKLREKLCDQSLSISQIFDECGVDYNGKLIKKFLRTSLG